LVDRRGDDGQKLILQLARDGFDVTAAFWLRPSEDNWWHLYIASKVVDEHGPSAAYRALRISQQQLAGTTISLVDVKLIGASHPITRDVLKIQKRYSGRTPIRFGGALLGGLSVEEALIYPPPLRKKSGPVAWESRRLKTPVEQITQADEALSPQDHRALEQIVASGISPAQADYWVRKKRAEGRDRPPIPAGTVVKAQLAAWWGETPEDDPNPLLLVEAPDGARGLTFKDNTDPL